ncbi:MAG TPA: SDR family NAD(P)-dependent oxidoreductase, partial [Caulobacteraceae bacterium]|nr:SDR family NAD(P)-dependent oxidoreductase [Caulobacteraceae bacterium]
MTGRVYAITGAFGVLGQAVAKAAAAQGARLALIDFAKSAPADLPSGDDVLVLGGVDLTDPAQAKAAVDAITSRLGGLDALINVAGGFRWELHQGGDPDTWRTLFRLNIETTANASRAALGPLKA